MRGSQGIRGQKLDVGKGQPSANPVTTSEKSIASMKVTNLTDESMGLCVLCRNTTIPRIAIGKKNPQLTQQTVNESLIGGVLEAAGRDQADREDLGASSRADHRTRDRFAGYMTGEPTPRTFYLYFSSVRDVRDQIEVTTSSPSETSY